VAPRTFPLHTHKCKEWKKKGWSRLPLFKYDPWSKPELFVPGAVEGVDYFLCRVCAEYGLDFRFARIKQHLQAHGLTEEVYRERYPGAPVQLQKTVEKRQATNMKRFGVPNPSQAASVQEKLRQAWDSKSPEELQEIKERIRQTNLERYGSENPFGSDLIKEKIRQVNVERYGVESPMQSPEILRRAQQTNLERYGATMFLQGERWKGVLEERRKEREADRREALIAGGRYEICPHCDEIFLAVTSTHKAICEGWPPGPEVEPCLCGHETSSLTTMKRHRSKCVAWLERDANAVMRARSVRTMLQKHGGTSVMTAPEIRARIEATNLERYGATNPLCAPQILEKLIARNMEKYGGPSPFSSPEVRAQLRRRFEEKYGVDNPFAAVPFQEKALRTCLAKIGLDFPEFERPAETVEDLVERYGVSHPLHHREYAEYHFGTYFDTTVEPNGLEKQVQALAPQLLYTGNRKFWRWLPALGSHKNPDFVLPSPNPEHPFRDVEKVVECFGSFFHGKGRTGMEPAEHEAQVVQAYAEVGLQCLVLWDAKGGKLEAGAKEKLERFLSPQ
jgi:hypothetical protein